MTNSSCGSFFSAFWLGICLKRFTKLKVWAASGYDHGFYKCVKHKKLLGLMNIIYRTELLLVEILLEHIIASRCTSKKDINYQACNQDNICIATQRVLQNPCEFAISIWYSRFIGVQSIYNIG
jgi:hypothetical protein